MMRGMSRLSDPQIAAPSRGWRRTMTSVPYPCTMRSVSFRGSPLLAEVPLVLEKPVVCSPMLRAA